MTCPHCHGQGVRWEEVMPGKYAPRDCAFCQGLGGRARLRTAGGESDKRRKVLFADEPISPRFRGR